MANLEKERTRIDDPGYPQPTIPERRDRLGWTPAAVGLIILIVAVAVVIGL